MKKYLVVSGGSRGIGRETTMLFHENDWQVINLSRTACDVPGVINFSLDFGKPNWKQEQGKALKSSVSNASQICLVHNAAVFYRDAVPSLKESDFRSALEINLIAPFLLSQLFIPIMKPGSSIIYIGSTLSEMAVPDRASYVITKHALVGMMRSTCQDLAGMGISTCCICPGAVNTTMLTSQVDQRLLDEFIKNKVTAGRLIEPDEIANLIYFCANNPVMNGAVLHANLGQINR